VSTHSAWQTIRICVEQALAEDLSEALLAHGALSVSIEDAHTDHDEEHAIFDEVGTTQSLWPQCLIIALYDVHCNATEQITQASTQLGMPHCPKFERQIIAEEDWVRLNQAQFQPITIANKLTISPSWHKPEDDKIRVILDPGVAFGTGSHPSTQLCLQWLVDVVQPGQSLLDYGCGSGILAIAAAKLGATTVCGIDIDEQAVIASRDNACRNQVQATFNNTNQAINAQYDIVIANILSKPLMLLAPVLCHYRKANGRIALAGILATQATQIIDYYRPWALLRITATLDGWVLLSH